MWNNEQLITTYVETGSVWATGKKLGISGQTVHERLKSIGYKLSNSEWSAEEIEELKSLVGHSTIAEIANRLARPYNGVALKISRLGIGTRAGNKRKVKPVRTTEYRKDKLTQYIKELDDSELKITAYARTKALNIESLSRSIQAFYPDWWEAYCAKHAVKPKTTCPYCETEFWPLSHKQVYCNRKCGDQARVDKNYFGGRRRETIGLAEKQCQLCGRKDIKGLSSHHAIGKENDPENEFLVALCPGCHQIVTILGGRNFSGTPEIWEALIQLVLIRKNGHRPNFKGVYCYVEIEEITEGTVEDYDSVDFFVPEAH